MSWLVRARALLAVRVIGVCYDLRIRTSYSVGRQYMVQAHAASQAGTHMGAWSLRVHVVAWSTTPPGTADGLCARLCMLLAPPQHRTSHMCLHCSIAGCGGRRDRDTQPIARAPHVHVPTSRHAALGTATRAHSNLHLDQMHSSHEASRAVDVDRLKGGASATLHPRHFIRALRATWA